MASPATSAADVAAEAARLDAALVADAADTLGGSRETKEPDHPSVIGHMVKSLMPGQDLTRVTIPPFFLEPRSLLERMADLMMHPDLLLGVNKLASPVGRMAALLRWYLSGWHFKTLGVKKPYNPIVGETFACVWRHEDGSQSQYFAEQVLHRPPVSAIFLENAAHGVSVNAHVWTKSQFQAPQTTKSILDGGCYLTLRAPGLGGAAGAAGAAAGEEEYFLTLPTFFAHNLILGTLRMEIGDSTAIICRATGLRCDIDFLQRTMFSDKQLTAVEATISKLGADGRSKGEVVASFSGHWDGAIAQTAGAAVAPLLAGCGGAAAAALAAAGAPFLDVTKLAVAPKWVLPLAEQGPWESRRLWQFATAELLKRPVVDWDAVDREKGQLEEEQRLLPCHRKEGAADFVPWPTKRFHAQPRADPLTGKSRDFFVFDGAGAAAAAPASAGASASAGAGAGTGSFVLMSRDLPDQRGGFRNAGADAAAVAAMKTIQLSARRVRDREAATGAGAGAASGAPPAAASE